MVRRTRRWNRPRLCLESLEQRLAPATFTVTNTADSGAGSLRQAIFDANGAAGQDTINFQAGVSGTILLTSTLSITDSVIINGPGTAALSVSGRNTLRPFTISNATSTIVVQLFDLTVTAGRSDGSNGGGILNDSETVLLNRVVVSNCTTNLNGGGIAVGAGGILSVRDSTISGNTANGGSSKGGGIYFAFGGGLNLQSCTLTGNTATGARGGGGLYFYGGVSSYGVTVANCTISGNAAPIGGGIALRNVNTTANGVLIENSTITGNTSTTTTTTLGYGGGGLCVVASGSPTIVVRSNILSGNTATAANGRSDIATFVELSLNNNAIGDTDGVNFKPGSGSNLINQNLLLGTLSNNGGLTQTIPFASTSPLLNAGFSPSGLNTDQRGVGFPRVIGPATDIGAFEAPVATVTNLNDSGPGSLRQAILDSNATPAIAETINFQPGLTGTITLASQLTITDSVGISGPGASAITVSGNNAVRVFDINDNNANTAIDVTISGLTVTAGRDAPGNLNGAGIRIANETVTVDRVVVSNCNAIVPGSSQGGGIDVGLNGDLIVRNSTITGNSTVGNGNGGGGGINVYGGGFGFVAGSSLLVENSTISNNTSNEKGGGIFFIGDVGAGGVTIRNSTITGNTAVGGGGLRLRSVDTTLGGILIQNSTFTGNRATSTDTFGAEGGGGLQLTSLNAYAVTIVSTIVSGNTSANGHDDLTTESGVTLNVSNSAIGDPDGFIINGTNQNNLPVGTPLGLFPLANNGGPTQTVAFAANSPLLNAGSNPANLTTDQRGTSFPRIANGAPDIGAFEATVFTVTSLDDVVAVGTLRFALQVANLTLDPEVIVFQAGLTGTINLASTLAITDSVSIAGPGASSLVVSGGNTVRVFNIDNGNSSVINVAIAGLTVTGGNVSGGDGGGLFTGNEAVTLDRVVVTSNVAAGTTGADGGGVGVGVGGSLTVRNSTISGNSAAGSGGGIYFNNGGSLLLENSTVSGNTAADSLGGGGVYFFGPVAASGFIIRNSTIANNTASTGGGVALRALNTAAAPVLIQNSTITGNASTTTSTAAGYGGGGLAVETISGTPTVTIVSTILSGNTASVTNGRGDIAANGFSLNVDNSAIGDPDGFALSGNNLAVGTALGLLPLANNGGPTQTIAFATNSPLIDRGSNLANLTTDQRGPGFPRVLGNVADIGAFEAPSFEVSNLNDAGAGSLRQAILSANQTVAVAETITFAAGLTGTITLSSVLPITDSVTITGPGATAIAVSGGNAVSVFSIDGPAAALTVTISGLTVTGGRSTLADGGGIFIGQEDVTLDGVVVSNCNAIGTRGGGIFAFVNVHLTIRNSTVSGNSAGTSGGGISFYIGGSLLLENSTISGNTAAGGFGGGVAAYGAIPGDGGFTVRNSTIANNTAQLGGGLGFSLLSTNAAPVLIQNSTITGNTATTTSTATGYGGGGIAVVRGASATFNIVSSIVSGNAATPANGRSDIAIEGAGVTLNVTNSAIGDQDGFTINGTNTANLPIGAALGLGLLANNGGPTQTIAFVGTSPLVNAGSNPAPAVAFDQRGSGFPRTVGGNTDIGAFEAPVLVVTNLNDVGPGSLRQAILSANQTAGVAETITFQAGLTGTIILASELPIADSVTIAGPGAAAIAVSGGNAVRVFDIDDGTATAMAVTISGLTVTGGNVSGSGGGLFVANEAVTVDRVVVTGNSAFGNPGNGGGIAVAGDGSLTVRNSTLSGNTAALSGGGIFLGDDRSLLLENSTISGNTAGGIGGGICFIGISRSGGFTIRNSTLANNKALNGGGILAFSANSGGSPVLIQNSTITGNTATSATTSLGYGSGGVGVSSPATGGVTIVSTIISGNTSANGRDDLATDISATLNVTNSAIGDPDGFTINGTNTGNLPFGAALGLLPLANNGGPTQTVALAATSPLRDAGLNPENLTTDQRGAGFTRVAGTAGDIGAFEAPVRVVTNLNDSGPGSLRQAVLDANATPGIAETIAFQAGLSGTIILASELRIFDGVNIAGPGASVITVSGNNAVRVFNFDNGSSAVITVAISGLTVNGGSATSLGGGGLFTANENVTLDRVVVTGNAAINTGLGVGGGGIGVGTGGVLTVRNSTVSGNSAARSGGGIYFRSGGSLLLENSTVSGNTAAGNRGGGVYFYGAVAAGGLTVRNSTIAGNTAASGGGIALRNLTTGATPVLIQNSTITGNAAISPNPGYGGGGLSLATAGTPTLTIVSSIVSGNTAAAVEGNNDLAVASAATLNVTNSAIGAADGFTINGTNTGNLAFGAALGLLPLANNGGPTQTVAFTFNSLLRNAGANPANLGTDQRGSGFTRVVGAAADIGAFEIQTATAPPARVASVVMNAGQTNATQRSRVTSITVTFDSVVTFVSVPEAFSLTRIGGGTANFTATAAVVNGLTVVTLTGFSGGATSFGSLADGRYTLLVRANVVTAGGQQLDGDADGAAGGDFRFVDSGSTTGPQLYRLYGDVNGDHVTNGADLTSFIQKFGGPDPAFDFNGDGVVNGADLTEFIKNFGKSLLG